jgi:CheY-like chemotaxis protein
MLKTARILIVDDEPANIELLRHVLEPAGFTNLVTTTDPRRVADLCAATPPDMVLLDLKMPHIDGFQLLEMLPDLVRDFEYLPVVVLTSDTSRESKALALSSGAKDFLNKPLSPTEVRLRVWSAGSGSARRTWRRPSSRSSTVSRSPPNITMTRPASTRSASAPSRHASHGSSAGRTRRWS